MGNRTRILALLVFCLCWFIASAAEAVGLAIGIRPIYADDKDRLKLPDTAGCVVVVVQKGGMGDLVGLKIGDVIKTFNGEPVQNVPLFMKQAQQAPGLKNIGIWRDGQAQTLVGQGIGGTVTPGGTGMAPPERAQPLDGFLGVTWDTPLEQARQQIQARGGFSNASASGSPQDQYWLAYQGSFAGRPAAVGFGFYQGKLYQGTAIVRSPVDDILKNYDAIMLDIAEKYGPANRRTGKYLDQKTTWLFPAGENRPNSIVLEIQRSSNAAAAAFFVKVEYTYGVTQKIIEDKKKSTTKKDL